SFFGPAPSADPESASSKSVQENLTKEDHVIEQMIQCWRAGERVVAEEILNRHPDLWNKPDEALETIYDEICLLHDFSQPASVEQFLERFRQWSAQIHVLFECHKFLGSEQSSLRFPQIGECFGDFRLQRELGRGATGRVFLATQASLAGRPMVLK